MKEHPILFSAPMVRALLAGTKTQTRRPLYSLQKLRDSFSVDRRYPPPDFSPVGHTWSLTHWRNATTGDHLWVRETWGIDQADNGGDRHWHRFVYRADPGAQPLDNGTPVPWNPSIHMPRRASRITLEITEVRVQRLQEISSQDAIAEGIEACPRGGEWRDYMNPNRDMLTPRNSYRSLWESINGPGSWDANPWVWAITFRRIAP